MKGTLTDHIVTNTHSEFLQIPFVKYSILYCSISAIHTLEQKVERIIRKKTENHNHSRDLRVLGMIYTG